MAIPAQLFGSNAHVTPTPDLLVGDRRVAASAGLVRKIPEGTEDGGEIVWDHSDASLRVMNGLVG